MAWGVRGGSIAESALTGEQMRISVLVESWEHSMSPAGERRVLDRWWPAARAGGRLQLTFDPIRSEG